MKSFYFLVVFLLAAACAQAQADSFYVWNKWCARKDTLLLFNSGNNTIRVYCKSMKPTEYKLKSLDIKALRIGTPQIAGDTMSVLAMPYPAKGKQMRLAILNAKTGRIIKTLYFVSDSIPQPIARIGNIENKESFRKTILAQTKLRVLFPNSLYSYPYTIVSYTFKDSTAKGPVALNVKTFFLTNAVLKEINEVPENTEVTFTNIKAVCPECASRILPDLKIKVK